MGAGAGAPVAINVGVRRCWSPPPRRPESDDALPWSPVPPRRHPTPTSVDACRRGISRQPPRQRLIPPATPLVAHAAAAPSDTLVHANGHAPGCRGNACASASWRRICLPAPHHLPARREQVSFILSVLPSSSPSPTKVTLAPSCVPLFRGHCRAVPLL